MLEQIDRFDNEMFVSVRFGLFFCYVFFFHQTIHFDERMFGSIFPNKDIKC